jgi:hypothetical protein
VVEVSTVASRLEYHKMGASLTDGICPWTTDSRSYLSPTQRLRRILSSLEATKIIRRSVRNDYLRAWAVSFPVRALESICSILSRSQTLQYDLSEGHSCDEMLGVELCTPRQFSPVRLPTVDVHQRPGSTGMYFDASLVDLCVVW